ncbi:hypothetical protein RUND412_006291 [Rhizina undulata]
MESTIILRLPSQSKTECHPGQPQQYNTNSTTRTGKDVSYTDYLQIDNPSDSDYSPDSSSLSGSSSDSEEEAIQNYTLAQISWLLSHVIAHTYPGQPRDWHSIADAFTETFTCLKTPNALKRKYNSLLKDGNGVAGTKHYTREQEE